MQPWILLDRVTLPSGGDMRLVRRGTEHVVTIDGVKLMGSGESGSEEALARLCCERVKGRDHPQLLIGGLGLGYTLRAALADVGPHARIVVAELVPALVTWAAGPLAPLFGSCLADPRVQIEIADVADVIAATPERFDTILLDVDNGPDGLTSPANARLYSPAGLKATRRALRPGGVFALWSAFRDEAFTTRLRRAGFTVEIVPVRARGTRGTRHVIWLATANAVKPAGGRPGSRRRSR